MLVLAPQVFGAPDWELLQSGELTDGWSQWFDVRVKKWKTVPWFADSRFPARLDSPNYRRPVSFRAKVAAAWAATPKWVKYRLLRRKMK